MCKLSDFSTMILKRKMDEYWQYENILSLSESTSNILRVTKQSKALLYIDNP